MNNMTNKNFIITGDKHVKEQLLTNGFKLISENMGIFTFVNAGNLTFSNDIDMKKITFTNHLSV